LSLFKKITATAAVVAAAGTLVATEVYATEGYFQNAIGARAKGMAGAGVADSKDATAITLNPAGLVRAGRQFNGAVSLFMPFRQFKVGGPGGFIAPGVGSDTNKSNKNIFLVPNLAYSHPISENTTLGLSLSGNGGMNTSYENSANANCPSAGGVFCGGRAGVDLTQVNISAGFGHRINKYLSIGAAPIFALQRIKVRGLDAFARISSNPDKLSDNGFSYSVGGGARFGVEFAPEDYLRLGFSVQTPLWMSKFKKYSGLFAERGGFDIPANVQAGIAFDVTPDLTFMFDWRHIFYSSVRSIANSSTGFNGTNLLGNKAGLGFGWNDTDTFKFAVEYNATEALTVRAGYSYNTQPINSRDVMFNIIAPAVSQHHITGGGTYKFSENSAFEFAVMYSPTSSVTGTELAGFGNPTRDLKLSMSQLEFTVGYNYHWN